MVRPIRGNWPPILFRYDPERLVVCRRGFRTDASYVL